MAQFDYLRATATNQNLIQEEIKMRLKLANACYHSAPNLLVCCIKTQKTEYIKHNFASDFV
jgi:hypothetical protein